MGSLILAALIYFYVSDADIFVFVKLQIRDYYTCRELITEAVEKFNAALDAQRAHNTACPMFYTLDPSADKLEHNYFLYRAKKKGTAKDDPSKYTIPLLD